MTRAVALLSCFLGVPGCSEVSAPPSHVSRAVAMFMCGPADGAATAIVLTHQPIGTIPTVYPNVSIAILRDVHQLAGGSFDINTDAGAWYWKGPNSAESALAGRVTIDSVASDLTVSGLADLTFPSGQFVSAFSAEWQQSHVTCP